MTQTLQPEPAEAAATSRNSFFQLFPSIMAPMFLAVIDQTIVATALPAISAEFGDAEMIAWVVVVYLVANTIAAPIYGRLGDGLGRARMMGVALGVMALGSVACALAPGLWTLVAARFLQGLGGGGLMTLSQSLIGETVPPRERARYQGYLAGVIVVSNALGPLAGAWLTTGFGWRSIFWFNMPLAGLAFLLALRLPRKPGAQPNRRFDYGGVFFFTAGVAPLLIALEQARRMDAALAPLVFALLLLAASALYLFVRHEARHPDPLLPMQILGDPTIFRADLMAALHGATLVALINFLPIYLRVSRGLSLAETGYLLLPIALGLGLGSLTTGRLVARTGRTAVFPSLGLIPANLILLIFVAFHEHLPVRALGGMLFFLALFLGSVMGVVQVTVQNSAGPARLGSAAATVQFSRAVGASFGVALTGAALFAAFALLDPQALGQFGQLLEVGPAALAGLPDGERLRALHAVDGAFRAAFFLVNLFCAGAMVAAWTLPMRRL